ncbi:hypothetical protein NM688_g5700 [Phlebia brevispora]|uniref:Uncharacterized protein n=1 Tax=Phlebia brevispora TaxID=194682 RepID=A0ACC1SR92_9APHY|nr:hypothetical protein NM688_g5700 [Phlebia brevispora]
MDYNDNFLYRRDNFLSPDLEIPCAEVGEGTPVPDATPSFPGTPIVEDPWHEKNDEKHLPPGDDNASPSESNDIPEAIPLNDVHEKPQVDVLHDGRITVESVPGTRAKVVRVAFGIIVCLVQIPIKALYTYKLLLFMGLILSSIIYSLGPAILVCSTPLQAQLTICFPTREIRAHDLSALADAQAITMNSLLESAVGLWELTDDLWQQSMASRKLKGAVEHSSLQSKESMVETLDNVQKGTQICADSFDNLSAHLKGIMARDSVHAGRPSQLTEEITALEDISNAEGRYISSGKEVSLWNYFKSHDDNPAHDVIEASKRFCNESQTIVVVTIRTVRWLRAQMEELAASRSLVDVTPQFMDDVSEKIEHARLTITDAAAQYEARRAEAREQHLGWLPSIEGWV